MIAGHQGKKLPVKSEDGFFSGHTFEGKNEHNSLILKTLQKFRSKFYRNMRFKIRKKSLGCRTWASALSLLDFGIGSPGPMRFFKCLTNGTSQFCRGTRH